MKIATYIMNWLIVCFFCFASWVFLKMLLLVAEIMVAGAMVLPTVSTRLLNNPWILLIVPLLWGVVTIFFLRLKNSAEKLTLHLSASFLFGLFVFSIYGWGAVRPFLSMTFFIR